MNTDEHREARPLLTEKNRMAYSGHNQNVNRIISVSPRATRVKKILDNEQYAT